MLKKPSAVQGSFCACTQPTRDDVTLQRCPSLAGYMHKIIPFVSKQPFLESKLLVTATLGHSGLWDALTTIQHSTHKGQVNIETLPSQLGPISQMFTSSESKLCKKKNQSSCCYVNIMIRPGHNFVYTMKAGLLGNVQNCGLTKSL